MDFIILWDGILKQKNSWFNGLQMVLNAQQLIIEAIKESKCELNLG
jgi:hypothetical protein